MKPKSLDDFALGIPVRPRLLLIAYCCSPEGGSEPAVGWTLARLAAERFDVTVLVEEHKFADEIRAWIDEHGEIPGLAFEFIPEKGWAHWLWAAGLGYLSYRWWHDRALARAKSMHAESPFDAVQMGTIIGFREPGRWYELGVPLIWGPVGGTHNFVRAFLGEAGIIAGLKELLRSCINSWQLRSSRRVRNALQRAEIVVAATSQTRDDLRTVTDRPIHVVSEITLRERESEANYRADVSDGLRVLWCGLHEPRKCLSLLIRALARVPVDVPMCVRVVGDGEMRRRWQRLAEDLNVSDRIEWLGWVSHDESIAAMQWADVFAFTSVRDTTGTVLLEALDAGVPVLTLDHQGAGDVVTDDSGIKVRVGNVDEVVEALANGLVELATDNSLRQVLSDGAVRRAAAYRMPAKRELWNDVWDHVVEPADDAADSLSDPEDDACERATFHSVAETVLGEAVR